MTAEQNRTPDDLVFAGIRKTVVALDRYTGEIVWQWTVPKGQSYISILVDGDRLIVGASGYLYCLDPLYGQLVWENPLTGLGVGVTALASSRGRSTTDQQQAALQQQQQAAAAAAASAS